MATICVGGAGRLSAQDPSVPQINFPPPPQSVRGPCAGPDVILPRQNGFPAEITLTSQAGANWLQSAQVTSRTHADIAAVRVGWAYVLATGPEFHQSDELHPPAGLVAAGSYTATTLDAEAHAGVKDLLVFVERVTFADGSVYSADHAKLAAFYTDCCTGANAGRIPPPPTARAQADVPGGGINLGPMLTPGLKPITFDVVSFKKAKERGSGREFPPDGDFIAYHGANIGSLILFAHIAPKGYFSIANEPEWSKTEFYDFQAKVAPEDVAAWKRMTLTDKRAMVGVVLADALKLKVHQQTEPQPVYELVVAKGGPKLMEYRAGDTVTFPGRAAQTGSVMQGFAFYLVCQNTSMAELVNTLSGPERAGRVVIDKTGLTGGYNFSVPLMPRSIPLQVQQMAEAAGVPTLQEGLKRLGLALVPAKDPVDEIVIDHIERPETN